MAFLARTITPLVGLVTLSGCAGLTPQQKMWLAEGQRAYEREQYPAAIQRLTLLVNEADDPAGLALALYLRGMSNARTGHRSLAHADLQRCVQLDANPEVTWKAYAVLGTLRFEEEQWDAAGRAYGEAVTRMPPLPPIDEVYFHLGQCYERTGRWAEALDIYRQITERYLFSDIATKARRRLAIGATHFAVQCGAFHQSANAETFRGELEQKGLAAYIRNEWRGDKTLHIVLVGRYATYAEARRGLATVLQYVPDAVLWP